MVHSHKRGWEICVWGAVSPKSTGEQWERLDVCTGMMRQPLSFGIRKLSMLLKYFLFRISCCANGFCWCPEWNPTIVGIEQA